MEKPSRQIKLNKISHSVRAAQAVLQYGVGAMVDFPDQTLVVSSPELWDSREIYDDRFAKVLGVDYFAVPTVISYNRFPKWYFCVKCRRFQPLEKWMEEYKKERKKEFENDPFMIRHMKCPKCRCDLVVARIVTVCAKGHLNDFPWIKWVHKQNDKEVCEAPELKIITGPSSSEGLEGVKLTCTTCNATATLAGAFNPGCFEKMDRETNSNDFLCEGNHPQNNVHEKCNLYPRTVQRGSSSVYFPVVYSSLVIPPYSNKINILIEKSQQFEKCNYIIDDEAEEKRLDLIKERLKKWAENIALEIGYSSSDVERILIRKWIEKNKQEGEDFALGYRFEEYAALNGEIASVSDGDFLREIIPGEEYQIPYVKKISLIEKIRVVHALVGFSRLRPVSGKKDYGFVEIKKPKTRWYPAYEARGEGIFIEFDDDEISKWSENTSVKKRADLISEHYNESFAGENYFRKITPKFVLLHTLSHLLIKQFSFECGYGIASLRERIYCSDESDGRKMSGIFIYTASGDSEGTLGGLVRQGRPDALPQIIKKAISSAKICSHDPVCILSQGQGRESLNLAACHACALLPETSCEERNGFLDRGLVIGTFEDKEIGFFNDFLDI